MGLTLSTEICGHRLTSSPPQWSLGEGRDCDDPLPLIDAEYRDADDVAIHVQQKQRDYEQCNQFLALPEYLKRPPFYSGKDGADTLHHRKLSTQSTESASSDGSPISVNTSASTSDEQDEFNTDSTDDESSPLNTVRPRFPVTHYSHTFYIASQPSALPPQTSISRSSSHSNELASSHSVVPSRVHHRHEQRVQSNGDVIHHSHSEHTLQRPRNYSKPHPPSSSASSSSIPTVTSSSSSLSSLASPSSLDEGDDEREDDSDDESSPQSRSRSIFTPTRIHSRSLTSDQSFALSASFSALSLSPSSSSSSISSDAPENCPRTLLSFMRAQRGLPLTL